MSSENLYIGCNGFVCAINPTNGTEIWRTQLSTQDGLLASLVSNTKRQDVNIVEDNGVVFVGCNGYLFGLNAKSGEQLWSNELKDIGNNDVTLSIGGKTIQTVGKPRQQN